APIFHPARRRQDRRVPASMPHGVPPRLARYSSSLARGGGQPGGDPLRQSPEPSFFRFLALDCKADRRGGVSVAEGTATETEEIILDFRFRIGAGGRQG